MSSRYGRHVPEWLGYVWHCGDPVCDCYQARIIRQTRTRGPIPSYQQEVLWSGTFTTGQSPIYATAELEELEAAMAEIWPEAHAQIVWAL